MQKSILLVCLFACLILVSCKSDLSEEYPIESSDQIFQEEVTTFSSSFIELLSISPTDTYELFYSKSGETYTDLDHEMIYELLSQIKLVERSKSQEDSPKGSGYVIRVKKNQGESTEYFKLHGSVSVSYELYDYVIENGKDLADYLIEINNSNLIK